MGVGLGLIFVLLSIIAFSLMLIWIGCGPGNKVIRTRIGLSIIAILESCWLAFFYYGISYGSELGGWAVLIGLVTSILTLFVPTVYKVAIDRENGT